MNPPTGTNASLLNGQGLSNLQLQQQQIQQLLAAATATPSFTAQQISQLLLQQQQPSLNGFTAPTITSAGQITSQHNQPAPQLVFNTPVAPTAVAPQPAASQASSHSSLPWPTCSPFPLTRVPYFDVNSYKGVNLEVNPSCDPNGLDLPLHDMNTLRFFFNLGVQQAKTIMVATKSNQHTVQAELSVSHMAQQQPQVSMMDQLLQQQSSNALLRQIAQQQQQAQQAQQNQQQHASLTNQQLQQQNQLLLAAARAQVGISEHRLQANIPGLQPDLMALAQAQAQVQQQQQQQQQQQAQQQSQHQHPVSVAGMTVIPSSATATVTPSITRSTPSIREVPSAKNSVGPNDAPDPSPLMLHQALLNFGMPFNQGQKNSTASSLHEARLQQLFGQQMVGNSQALLGADPLLKAGGVDVVKPVAVGGGSGDAAVSPRPPIPVDPSPPKALIEATRNQQAQTSPPTSMAGMDLLKPRPESIIGAHRPGSAREPGSHSITNGTGKTSAPPVLDDAAPSHLFQVSERHFTEAFRSNNMPQNPIGIARSEASQPTSSNDDSKTSEPSTSTEPKKEELEENKPALAPILMMSFLNSCMNTMKTTLNANGTPINVDPNGQPVDFSSRPVDKIFQVARQQQQTNNIREMSPIKRKVSPGDGEGASHPPESVTIGVKRADVKTEEDDSGSESGGKRLRIATDED